MNRESLRSLLESPYRRLIVITGTFLIGLATLLPLADEYSELGQSRTELLEKLAECQAAKNNVAKFQRRVETRLADLQRWDRRTVSQERVNDFRSEVVELVRQTGCQIRLINAGSPRVREWLEEDDALNQIAAKGKKKAVKTGYELQITQFKLSVSGPIPKLKQLLGKLHARQAVAHTHRLSMRPIGADRNEAELELELWLYDLTKPTSDSA